jgi:hypothetical protein
MPVAGVTRIGSDLRCLLHATRGEAAAAAVALIQGLTGCGRVQTSSSRFASAPVADFLIRGVIVAGLDRHNYRLPFLKHGVYEDRELRGRIGVGTNVADPDQIEKRLLVHVAPV